MPEYVTRWNPDGDDRPRYIQCHDCEHCKLLMKGGPYCSVRQVFVNAFDQHPCDDYEGEC